MKISTRSRYGLRLMVSLARHYGNGLTHLKDIAAEENISEKYLSQLILPLKANGLVRSGQGAYGGYVLTKPPAQISVRDIIEPLEGGIRLMECVRDAGVCGKSSDCGARGMWTRLENQIIQTLDKIRLNSLIREPKLKGKKK